MGNLNKWHLFDHLNPGRYGAILADPAIPFETWSKAGEGRSPQHHYKCSTFDELAAMPIASLAAPNCFLLLWIPLRSVVLVEPLMRAWDFTFSGVGFCWVKQNRSGVGWFMGGGYGTRHNVEICWLWRRGKPGRKSAGVRELIIAPVRQHSRKPDEIYSRIEALCDGPYLELFARQQWPGWFSVGDEIGKFETYRHHQRED
jgi:N6-adenosine-specific RNA methylase IME4